MVLVSDSTKGIHPLFVGSFNDTLARCICDMQNEIGSRIYLKQSSFFTLLGTVPITQIASCDLYIWVYVFCPQPVTFKNVDKVCILAPLEIWSDRLGWFAKRRVI